MSRQISKQSFVNNYRVLNNGRYTYYASLAAAQLEVVRMCGRAVIEESDKWFGAWTPIEEVDDVDCGTYFDYYWTKVRKRCTKNYRLALIVTDCNQVRHIYTSDEGIVGCAHVIRANIRSKALAEGFVLKEGHHDFTNEGIYFTYE